MPSFDTPAPISVTVELESAEVRVTATDRTDTVVEVRPSNAADESDMEAAGRVRVEFADGELRITGPKTRLFDFSRKTRSVDVAIALPTGSALAARLQLGDLRCTGTLGECRFKTSAGSAWLERTGTLNLGTSAGNVTAEGVTGDVDVSTGSGKVRLGPVTGSAVVKNSNGVTEIESAGGDVRVRSANGDIQVGRAGANVDAKTSNGAIRLGEVARGTVVLGTSMGDLEIGVAEGTAAWLGVDTGFGHVTNLLEGTGGPGADDETVEVRGRTSFGDITIRRS